MAAITYRLPEDKLFQIRENAARSQKTVPKYLEWFIDMAASKHGLIQSSKPAKRGTQIRKGKSK